MTQAQFGRVVTARAYVVTGNRVVFMVGLPSGSIDRLGVARLGGHREAGETAWQCAAREVLEESSVVVRPLNPPVTYWVAPPHDPALLAVGPWESAMVEPPQALGEPAPLLVAWREEAGERVVSVTYFARAEGAPVPAAETQGLLLLRPDDVLRLAREQLTLAALLRSGGQAVLKAALDLHLPLEPLLQLRALARILGDHPTLLGA